MMRHILVSNIRKRACELKQGLVLIATAATTHASTATVTGNGVSPDGEVRQCYSELLRDNFDFAGDSELRYRLLSFWDKRLHEDSRLNPSIYTAHGAGTFEESQRHVGVDYNKATALHVGSLDPQASAVIRACLDHLDR